MQVLGKITIFWRNQPKTTQASMDQPKNADEEEIIIALRINNQKAIEEVYKQHWPLIRNLILKNNGTEDDAWDIYQEAFIVLIENLRKPGFQLTCKISTYLYSVARIIWLNSLRKNKPFIDISDYVEIVLVDDPEEEEDEEGLPSNKEIVEAIVKLGSPCTEILIFVYYIRFKMKDLVIQIPSLKNENNARKRKFSCMKQLKKLLGVE